MGGSDSDGVDRGRLFEARLAEHIQARQEMTSAISNQHLVLTFGSASIVGVFVAGFLVWQQPADSAVFLAVPLISAWALAMWLAEVVRMLRVVQFCREQERLVNEVAGGADPENLALRFESWRAREEEGSKRTITWTYISVVIILAGAYLAGLGLGVWVANWVWWAKTIIGCAAVVILAFYLRWVLSIASEWTSDVNKTGAPAWLAALMHRLPGWLVRRSSNGQSAGRAIP
jgi:hypothetical protein